MLAQTILMIKTQISRRFQTKLARLNKRGSMYKPSIITLRIPKELKQRLTQMAERQGVSLNQFSLYLLAGEVARLEGHDQGAAQAFATDGSASDAQIFTSGRQAWEEAHANGEPNWETFITAMQAPEAS
jgi:hypothetical protein